MSRQVSPTTGDVYGLERVSRLWGVSRATIYRHRHRSEEAVRRRRGPQGAMAEEGLMAAIRRLLEESPFHGEGYRKMWARLRFAGIRTSRTPRSAAHAREPPVGAPTRRPAARLERPTTARSPPTGWTSCGAPT